MADKVKPLAGKPVRLAAMQSTFEYQELKGKARVVSGETRGVDPIPISKLNALGRDGWHVVAHRVNSARQLVYALMERFRGQPAGRKAKGKKKPAPAPEPAGGGNFHM